MAAVTPQTILCEIERYYPAASVVKAATTPSRYLVVGNVARASSREYRFEKELQSENVVEDFYEKYQTDNEPTMPTS